MKIESLNYNNRTSKFIFEVVSNDREYLASVLTAAEEHVKSKMTAIKEPDVKHSLTSDVGLIPSEKQDDSNLYQPFHVMEGKSGLKRSFQQAVLSSKPSGLGTTSDSPEPSYSSKSNEEEEEEE